MSAPETVISINLARAMKGQGEIVAEGELASFASSRAPVLAGPLAWRIRVAPTGKEIWLDGRLKGVTVAECARCLDPVRHQVDTRFQALLLHRDGARGLALEYAPEDDQERYVFGDPVVDLTALAAEFFELALPSASLCRPDCPGLDSVSGRRREVGGDRPGERRDDPRWKILEELDLSDE